MKSIRRPGPASSKFRQHWSLKPGSVFLNHGSFGACPAAILELQAELRAQMEAEPVQFLWRRYDEQLDRSRAEVARFVGARLQDLVMVTNATTAINSVLRSIKLGPGDEVLTTDHDYNACHNVLVEATSRTGARLVVAHVPFPVQNSSQITEAILSAATKRTRLALIDHVTSSTALIFPVARIIRELERRGIDTFVDGAHAPGMVDVDLSVLAPAYYTANLHKWVCAPKGCAFLWAREDKQRDLQPAVISHGNNTPRRGFTAFQDRFDWAGTFDPTAWICAGETIHWMQGRLPGGWPAIRTANHLLTVRARMLLCHKLGIQPPCPGSLIGSMATLLLPKGFPLHPKTGKIDPEQLLLYDKHKIEVPFFRWGHPEKRYFRISAHLYNSLGEYDYLAEILRSFSASETAR